jgi:hypothetical protein
MALHLLNCTGAWTGGAAEDRPTPTGGRSVVKKNLRKDSKLSTEESSQGRCETTSAALCDSLYNKPRLRWPCNSGVTGIAFLGETVLFADTRLFIEPKRS